MNSLPDDALLKILDQINAQAVMSQRSLQVVRAQIQSKEKERKILQLTERELGGVPKGDDRMFKGVGKMFIRHSRSELETEHSKQEKALNEELAALGKRKGKYLEKQFDEANSHLRDIMHSQQRERQ